MIFTNLFIITSYKTYEKYHEIIIATISNKRTLIVNSIPPKTQQNVQYINESEKMKMSIYPL